VNQVIQICTSVMQAAAAMTALVVAVRKARRKDDER
jgi:hypothetical protein